VSRLTSTLAANRKLSAWLAFGAAGLATGAVWASGFATTGGANRAGGTVESPAMAKTAPSPAAQPLSGTASSVATLKFDWSGRWGSIHDNTVMFKVDLTGSQFTGKTYNVATLLTNTSHLTGWSSLQLKFEQEISADGSCDPADLTAATNSQLLNVDNQDAGVYWNGLAGNKVYCVGVTAAHGDDALGTFLRSADENVPSDFPTFITTVDRAS
jgi:hypothetical protein